MKPLKPAAGPSKQEQPVFNRRGGHFGKRPSLRLTLSIICALPIALTAPGNPRPPNEFELTRITKNLITAPQFSYTGAQQFQTDQRDRWLEVEVEFMSAPEFTPELTFKYFILLNGKLLTGEVAHSNIPAGRDNRSVMYVPPRTLARYNNRPMTLNAIQNIAVQILQQGAVKSESSLVRGQPRWYANIPQIAGFILNKNETPFAPLYWDRYQQIKRPP